MKIFLDTSNIADIETWLEHGIVDGVTTNPSIMLKQGNRDLRGSVTAIAHLIAPRPVSVEVYTNELSQMLQQAREFATWASNIVVKITIITEQGASCLPVIRTLASENINVNCTACLTFTQLMLATKAGARYVSLLIGRISEEGGSGYDTVSISRKWLDIWGYQSEIIAGSIRSVADVRQVAMAGVHIATIPPQLLPNLLDHKYSRFTVKQLIEDGQEAFNKRED